jgi:hypothetical protein
MQRTVIASRDMHDQMLDDGFGREHYPSNHPSAMLYLAENGEASD